MPRPEDFKFHKMFTTLGWENKSFEDQYNNKHYEYEMPSKNPCFPEPIKLHSYLGMTAITDYLNSPVAYSGNLPDNEEHFRIILHSVGLHGLEDTGPWK